MISSKKVMDIKVIEFVKIYNFYFSDLFIRQTNDNIVYKTYSSLL